MKRLILACCAQNDGIHLIDEGYRQLSELRQKLFSIFCEKEPVIFTSLSGPSQQTASIISRGICNIYHVKKSLGEKDRKIIDTTDLSGLVSRHEKESETIVLVSDPETLSHFASDFLSERFGMGLSISLREANALIFDLENRSFELIGEGT